MSKISRKIKALGVAAVVGTTALIGFVHIAGGADATDIPPLPTVEFNHNEPHHVWAPDGGMLLGPDGVPVTVPPAGAPPLKPLPVEPMDVVPDLVPNIN